MLKNIFALLVALICMTLLVYQKIDNLPRQPLNLNYKTNESLGIYNCHTQDTNEFFRINNECSVNKRANIVKTTRECISNLGRNFYVKRLKQKISEYWLEENCKSGCYVDDYQEADFELKYIFIEYYKDNKIPNILLSILPGRQLDKRHRELVYHTIKVSDSEDRLVSYNDYISSFSEAFDLTTLNKARYKVIKIKNIIPFYNKKMTFTIIGLGKRKASILSSFFVNLIYKIEIILFKSSIEHGYDVDLTPIDWLLSIFNFSLECLSEIEEEKCEVKTENPTLEANDYEKMGDVEEFRMILVGIVNQRGNFEIRIGHNHVLKTCRN